MKKREQGYYWVMWFDKWIIAEYVCDDLWFICGDRNHVEEESLGEINENRITK